MADSIHPAPSEPAPTATAAAEEAAHAAAAHSPRSHLDFCIPFGAGMLVTLVGAFWDASRHPNGLATGESLLNPVATPARGMIYGGATIMAASLVLHWRDKLSFPISVGLRTKAVMGIGVVTPLCGSPLDERTEAASPTSGG